MSNLQAKVPKTTLLLNQDFNRATILPQMRSNTVVHLATHAAFVSGQPESSFILLGNGERITLQDIRSWNLPNVDLVVLSACETGLGGQLGNGEEILGFGYRMQRTGARAAIASLWQVSDGGTQVLMNAFYDHLLTGSSKTAALQAAQIDLIRGTATVDINRDRGIAVQFTDEADNTVDANRSTPAPAPTLEHPYYWAPFILIGNGL